MTLPAIGSFLATSWGYDQTNVDFYKVVGQTAKCLRLQRWTKVVRTGHGSPQEGVVPGDGPARIRDWDAEAKSDGYEKIYVEAPVFVHRAQWHPGFASTTVQGHYAHVWDGTPAYQTGPGWGH